MDETVQHGDFIELSYTGSLADGSTFDSTEKSIICIGQQQLLPGLDNALAGKELGKEFKITLKPEEAFGKRDIKKLRIIPMSTFREHKMDPHPGLQVDVDGEIGIVTSISGGRVIVNFNHPLAGKEVSYTVKVIRKVSDTVEQINAFLHATLRLPAEQVAITVEEQKATVLLPMELPVQFTDAVGKKIAELTKLESVTFHTKSS